MQFFTAAYSTFVAPSPEFPRCCPDMIVWTSLIRKFDKFDKNFFYESLIATFLSFFLNSALAVETSATFSPTFPQISAIFSVLSVTNLALVIKCWLMSVRVWASVMQPRDVVQLCHRHVWSVSCWYVPGHGRSTVVQTLSSWSSRCRYWGS